MNLKAWLLILFITSLPFIAMEFVSPGFGLDSLFGGGDSGIVSSQAFGACFLQAEVPCISSGISSPDGRLSIKIGNSFDNFITVTRIGCSKNQNILFECGKPGPGGKMTICDERNLYASSIRISPGGDNEFSLSCTDENGNAISISRGDAYQGKINIGYMEDGSSSPVQIHGMIVQDAG